MSVNAMAIIAFVVGVVYIFAIGACLTRGEEVKTPKASEVKHAKR